MNIEDEDEVENHNEDEGTLGIKIAFEELRKLLP